MTTISCPSSQWMLNQHLENPCLVAQAVGQLCDPGYSVSQTNFHETDYVPNATTSNNCTCCWSIYNLLSGCSYCAGQNQYPSWTTWTNNCGSDVQNRYLPAGLNLSASYGIPYWAATNPTNWTNDTFNVAQAALTQVSSDLTGGPLPTTPAATVTSSSSSSTLVGAIVGGVIGGIVIVVVGVLIAFWVTCRHNTRRTRIDPTEVRSFNPSRSVISISPSIRGGSPVPSARRPSTSIASPLSLHSGSTHAQTSLLPPISPGFSPRGQCVALPFVDDAAEMITPFLATSSQHRATKSDGSASIKSGRSTEALSERIMAPAGQRARLNPPPYSAALDPGSSGEVTPVGWKVSTKQNRNGSVSARTTYSAHSRTSTSESAQNASQRERSRSRAGPPYVRQGSVETITHGKLPGGSARRPPVV